MSFLQRMRQVRDPGELHELMAEVRERGSEGWTLKAVQKRVPEHLWPVLEEHFSTDGLILGLGASEQTPDIEATRFSILATIRQLQQDLNAARESAARVHQERMDARRSQDNAEIVHREEIDPDPREEVGPPQVGIAMESPAERHTRGSSEPPRVMVRPRKAPDKKRKHKRRLVKGPEDLRTGPKETESEQETAPPSEIHGGHEGNDAIAVKAEPSIPTRDATRDLQPVGNLASNPAAPEKKVADSAADEAFDSHDFSEGWCTICGISTDVARQQGWDCDAIETANSSKHLPDNSPSGPSGSHDFDGNWCVRCGLSREQGSRFKCN